MTTVFVPAPHATRVVTLAPERRGILYCVARVIAWRIDSTGAGRPEPILATGRKVGGHFAFMFDAGETVECAATGVLYSTPAAWAQATIAARREAA